MGMLEGKVAIVTGAGRGIGRATAEIFSEEGADLVVCDLDEEPAEETALRVRKNGHRALVSIGNICDRKMPEQIMAATAREFGRLDILVNNAGHGARSTIHRMTDEQFQAMLDVHLVAPFRLIRASCPLMRDQAKRELEEGAVVHRKIVNVTSVLVFGSVGSANYATAKAGLIGLTKTVAKEWAPFNIHCNAVAFGPIQTRLIGPRDAGVTFLGRAVGLRREEIEQTIQAIPLGRPGTPREAASGILYLASPLSDYVNGDLIRVDGGYLM